MNNEIKEILKHFQDVKEGRSFTDLSFKQTMFLFDYITNLQEGNHNLLQEMKYMQNKNNKLIEENKHLDDVNCKLRKGGEILKDTNKLLLQQKGQLQEDLDMLDKRIDKAIDKLYCYGEVFDSKILQQFQKEMLNNLEGRDDYGKDEL